MAGVRSQVRVTVSAFIAAAWTLLCAAPAGAQLNNEVPAQARGLDIEEHVGATVPLELRFTDSSGQLVRLGDYFKGDKPALVAMVYYRCPIVCDVLMEKLAGSFNKLDYTIGTEFNVLYFSIDHSETPDAAHEKKLTFLEGYNRPTTDAVRDGWRFHTGDAQANRQLADALGFKYRPTPEGEYSHPVGIFMLTPDGKISRYLYGFDYPPRDLKIALLEASQGKLVRSVGERLMLFCYMYDPKAGAYTLRAVRVMQVAGVLTVLGLGTLISALFIGERIRRRAWAAKKNGQRDGAGEFPRGGDISSGMTA